MKIVIGCDVDPNLPAPLMRRPDANVWQCLDNIDRLLERSGGELPPITWLIRSDESIRFSTGAYDSGFTAKERLWRSLEDRGHELGWHFHAMSFVHGRGQFGLDPDPAWLAAAHGALAAHFRIRATRSGWDYCNNQLLPRLDALGVDVDFSALPGNIIWQQSGDDAVVVDWSRCPRAPYHPSARDYQQPGTLGLLEVPITQFRNSPLGAATRMLWRMKRGNWSMKGLRTKTRMLTQPWTTLPDLPDPRDPSAGVCAFFFHPEDLHPDGIANGLRNIAKLARLPGAQFVKASDVL